MKKEKFTFRQALLNVIIACSIVIGLSLSNGFDFYKRTENGIVILVVILVALITLLSKWRARKSKTKEE